MKSIMVIDDNADFRSNFREVLGFENYVTLEAENGRIGLQMIQQHLPDIILCDVDMPVMNGIEVLRRVKANPKLAKIPFVIITGQSDADTRQTAQELGVDAYLTKPVPITEFLYVVIRFLQARTAP